MSVKHETPGPAVVQRLESGVLTLTLNRPERRNAVDDAMADELYEAVAGVAVSPDCRVIVLDGAGPSFCAGWDVAAVRGLQGLPREAVEARFERNRRLLDALRDAPQVTVAAVHGAVMGFGLGLVARCDIAVASESAVVALPEIGLGVVPAIVMVDLLETLPEKVALDWLLSGEKRTARDALAAGLLSRVVSDEGLADEVEALVRRLAGHDPGALRGTKLLYRRLCGLDGTAAVQEAIRTAARELTGED